MRRQRLRNSFQEAGRGLLSVWKSEQNFRVQALAAVGVIAVSFILPLLPVERAFLILLGVGVLLLELLNTIVERLLDLLKPRLHQYVLVIKEIAAGAVLLAAATALVIGIMIFYPHFLALFK